MCRKPKVMKLVLLTGGIGSGKSKVSAVFQAEGIPVYFADTRAKELYLSVPGLLDNIEGALHCSLRDEAGGFDAKKMASIIFADKEKLEKVEALLFPTLVSDFKLFAARFANAPFVVMESATALEKEYFKGLADKIVLVNAPYKERLARACTRDGLSKEQVLTRMQHQKLMNAFSRGEAKPEDYGVDFVINNDSTLENLLLETKNILAKIATSLCSSQ